MLEPVCESPVAMLEQQVRDAVIDFDLRRTYIGYGQDGVHQERGAESIAASVHVVKEGILLERRTPRIIVKKVSLQ